MIARGSGSVYFAEALYRAAVPDSLLTVWLLQQMEVAQVSLQESGYGAAPDWFPCQLVSGKLIYGLPIRGIPC